MSVHRIMGIETEYGIVQRNSPYANPMLMSSQVVLGYRELSQARRHPRWDYLDENPLVDARGFELPRAAAHPSLLTDDPDRPAPAGPSAGGHELQVTDQERPAHESYDDPGAANVILTNGARLYVDHAHPEYSSPEVTTPLDAVRWDVAGELIMARAAREASRAAGNEIVLYKNNIDGKGASYGTHENYLVDRAVPFEDIVTVLTPHLVTRTILTGSGRVGLGVTGQEAGFQLSQRADYIEAEVGLETTLRRPIINTRDEPHADRDHWRRLHIIIGDANLFQTATYLKLGATAAVLWLVEHLEQVPEIAAQLTSLTLADPVAAVQQVSRDLNLDLPLELADGRTMTAAQIQRSYIDAIEAAYRVLGLTPDAETTELLQHWSRLLDTVINDKWAVSHEIEWVAKLQLLDRMREREHLTWDNPKLAALDLQWSDTRPERGIAAKLDRAGAVVALVERDDIERAVTVPPATTRAYFRGRVVDRFADHVVAASWDSIVLDVPGAKSLSRIPMLDPHRGTAAHVAELIDASADVGQFVSTLQNSSEGQ